MSAKQNFLCKVFSATQKIVWYTYGPRFERTPNFFSPVQIRKETSKFDYQTCQLRECMRTTCSCFCEGSQDAS